MTIDQSALLLSHLFLSISLSSLSPQAMAGRSDDALLEELNKVLSDNQRTLSQDRAATSPEWNELFDRFGLMLAVDERVRLKSKIMTVLQQGPSVRHSQCSGYMMCFPSLSDALCCTSYVSAAAAATTGQPQPDHHTRDTCCFISRLHVSFPHPPAALMCN
jgi:hypothetical protein